MSDFFGDYEPEDAWDADDAPSVQARNLIRRMQLLDGVPEPRTTDAGTLLDMIEQRIEALLAARSVHGRDRIRLDQIIEDIPYVRSRL